MVFYIDSFCTYLSNGYNLRLLYSSSLIGPATSVWPQTLGRGKAAVSPRHNEQPMRDQAAECSSANSSLIKTLAVVRQAGCWGKLIQYNNSNLKRWKPKTKPKKQRSPPQSKYNGLYLVEDHAPDAIQNGGGNPGQVLKEGCDGAGRRLQGMLWPLPGSREVSAVWAGRRSSQPSSTAAKWGWKSARWSEKT